MVIPNTEKFLEVLYDDLMDVIVRQKEKDPTTHITKFKEKSVLEAQPCRLSRSTSTDDTVSPQGVAASVDANYTLFLSPGIEVPESSKIIVTHLDKKAAYKRSGKPATYQSHQEIAVKPWEDWA